MACTFTAFTALYFHHGLGSVDAAAPYIALILVDYLIRAGLVLQRRPTISSAIAVLDSTDPEKPVVCTFTMKISGKGPSEAGQYYFICIP